LKTNVCNDHFYATMAVSGVKICQVFVHFFRC
jgi:hypothetical protein